MKSDFTMWFLIRVCVRTLMDQTWIHWMIRSMISIWIESKERFESQKLRIESDFQDSNLKGSNQMQIVPLIKQHSVHLRFTI